MKTRTELYSEIVYNQDKGAKYLVISYMDSETGNVLDYYPIETLPLYKIDDFVNLINDEDYNHQVKILYTSYIFR